MSIFSIGKEEQSIPEEPRDLEAILARISAGASGRDEHPSFPEDPFARLAPTGVLAIPVPDPIGRQGAGLVRGGVARVTGGRRFRRLRRPHTRWPLQRRGTRLAPGARASALEGDGAIAAGTLLLGGGAPTRFQAREPLGWCRAGEQGSSVSRLSVRVRRAWIARSCLSVAPRDPLLAYVDLSEGVSRYNVVQGRGMRASESHRVVFEGTPVSPSWENRELLRNHTQQGRNPNGVTWAGISDTAIDAALDVWPPKPGMENPMTSLPRAGRMLAARAHRQLASNAADRADGDPVSLPGISTELRESVARSCREILDEAARAVGSHPFAISGPLDRARRISNSSFFTPLEPALPPRERHLGPATVKGHSDGTRGTLRGVK